MGLLTYESHPGVEVAARTCGALPEIEAALDAAYLGTASAPKRLNPSSVVVSHLRRTGWRSGRVWAPPSLPKQPNDQFDGWKAFHTNDEAFGVAAEIEWSWERVYFDLLKFWRGTEGGQIAFGIEVL